MDRMPDDDLGSTDEKRTPNRPLGPNVVLLMLIVLCVLFGGWLLRLMQPPAIVYSDFLRQLEAGNVKSFIFMGSDTGLGELKRIPPEIEPVSVVSVTKTEASSDTKSKDEPETKNSESAPATEVVGKDSDAKSQPPLEKSTVEALKWVSYRKNLDFQVQLLPGSQNQNELSKLLALHKVRTEVKTPFDITTIYLFLAILIPLAMVGMMWSSLRRSQSQLFGGGFLSGFTKSPAKRYEGSKQGVTFKDVAGLEGVKADLLEIVEFLKDPGKFQKLGGRVPKGVLLNGPPGTGKTLLARAIAGEAGVPFYSVNGSEFIQMFVGVGASRVRDLFRNAKENSPAIIFIDEIDAVGRQRGAGLGGGHDEREQTLNQILSEMDGFSQTDFVIVVAATNRPDVLDPALLRPGRFDRHVTVDRPTQKGRLELFKVHTRNVPLAVDVELEKLASATIGLTGADIRNIVNEAALWAARNAKSAVEMDDFEYARDKIIMGAKREEVFTEKEKERTAYHEAGHAILGWNLSGSNRVHKVTVVPRGRALGVTWYIPVEERMDLSESELKNRLAMMLGGRAAEKLIYNECTAGAENDLERATDIARHMVTSWGMSSRIGPVSYKLAEDDPFLGREIQRSRMFSEHTLELIDEEVARILHEASDRAMTFLTEHRDQLERLTRELIRQEELDEKEIEGILGPSALQQRNGHAVTLAPSPETATR